MASVYKTFGEKEIDDDSFLTTVGSVGAVVNGLSRVFWSTLQDKIGFKKVYFLILTIEVRNFY
jgi:hypothetical protein